MSEPLISDEQIVDMVRQRQGHCYPGMSLYSVHRMLVSPGYLRGALGTKYMLGVQNRYELVAKDVTLARLRSMAKRGLLAERPLKRGSLFCTPELAAAIAAEEALSDGERAERTAAAIRAEYAERKEHYGDKVPLWIVTPLARIPEDGYDPAHQGGLITKVGGGYVPAECYDAFAEALDAYQARQKELEHKCDEYQAEVNRMFPPMTGECRISLTLSQWAEIRERL